MKLIFIIIVNFCSSKYIITSVKKKPMKWFQIMYLISVPGSQSMQGTLTTAEQEKKYIYMQVV
jgi:hypothetical protein